MNTNTNIFEFASRHKFRYPYKGVITTEDLWDLTPAQLDVVYKALNANVKVAQEDSLMKNMSDADAALLMQIEIVKYIFAVKEQEAESRKKAAENTAKKQRIMEILAKKQDDALENMSEADLLKMLNEL
jgi:hypothetical protein